MIAAASDKGKEQRKNNGEKNSYPCGCSYTTDAADGDAGKGGMSEGIREKTHSAGNNHGGHETE